MVVALRAVDCELNKGARINGGSKIKVGGKKKASEPT